MNAYKVLSIALAALMLVGGSFYLFERSANSKKRRELNNKVAELTGMVQETETAFSRLAKESNDLVIENDEIKALLKDRDEEAVALTEVALRWKSKYFKAKNVTQTVVPSEDGEDRIRVDFSHEEDPLRVSGFTLTNPPEAEVSIEWTRDLKLSLILTKDEDDVFRIYLDSDADVGGITFGDLKLSVDPSILGRKWYEKIGIGGAITVGEGVASNLSLMYNVVDDWSVGPTVLLYYDGNTLKKLYGVNALWYPFR